MAKVNKHTHTHTRVRVIAIIPLVLKLVEEINQVDNTTKTNIC